MIQYCKLLKFKESSSNKTWLLPSSSFNPHVKIFDNISFFSTSVPCSGVYGYYSPYSNFSSLTTPFAPSFQLFAPEILMLDFMYTPFAAASIDSCSTCTWYSVPLLLLPSRVSFAHRTPAYATFFPYTR